MAAAISTSQLRSSDSSMPGKSQRSVYKIISSSNSSMGSMVLKNVIQGDYQNYVSPFFLFDEFGPMQLSKGAPFRVDAHPHAGIIPTTYLFQGNAHHRDSMDNDFQYTAGDFIQFTSGKGALHMEETGDALYEQGGTFHGIQSWLNMPPHLKKSEPYSAHLRKEEITVIEQEDVTIRVVLGEVFGTKAKFRLLMPVIYWHISMKADKVLELPVDPSLNGFIYLLQGTLEVKDAQTVTKNQAVLYERDGDHIRIKALENSDFLVLGGAVNNESFEASGPFVLNNKQELNQAYNDFQQGKFGDLAKTNGKKRN